MRLFLVTLVGMVVVWQLQLPFRLGGIVLSLIAIWTGIRLLIGLAAPARAGVRPRGRGGIITGLVLSVAVLLILAAEAVYYPVVSDLEQCRAEADTQTAQDLCDQATKDRIERLKEELDRRAANS
jgi:cytochrome c-type biogenesis protein CcmH/NrfG